MSNGNIVFKPAERVESRLNFGLSGPSGSGKTVAALRMAYGITGDWSKVFCIDTEHGSASLYQGDERWSIGQFMHFNLDKPYSPDRYIQVIEAAVRAGAEVIIIDQISHAWSGEGGVLSIKEAAERSGKYNSYTAWAVATPEHNRLFETIITSPVHMICTMRSKTEYAFDPSKKGRNKVQKLGMAPIQRADTEYEWTVLLDLDRDTHKAAVSKTRSPVVIDGEEYEIDEDLGRGFLKYLQSAAGYTPVGSNPGYVAPQTPESRAQAAAEAAAGKEPVNVKKSPKAEPSPSETTTGSSSEIKDSTPETETPPSEQPSSEPTQTSSDPSGGTTEEATVEVHPWADPTLSIEEARNIMYAVAVAEYGFKDTDEVRQAIMESGNWTSIGSSVIITEIAKYLQHQGAQKEAEASA